MRGIFAALFLIAAIIGCAPAKADIDPQRYDITLDDYAVEPIRITPQVCESIASRVGIIVERMQAGETDEELTDTMSAITTVSLPIDAQYVSVFMVTTAIPHIRSLIGAPETMKFLKVSPVNTMQDAISLNMKIKCAKIEGHSYDVPKRNLKAKA